MSDAPAARPMPVVCFKGAKGHGKTTAANILIEGLDFEHITFAAPLKAACKAIFGLTDEEMEDAVLKETPLDRWPFLSPRQIMQTVGTDLFREWLPDVWVRAWEREVRAADARGAKGVATPDMRFPNEAVEAVNTFDALILDVFNPRIEANETANHVSEQLRNRIQHHEQIVNDQDRNTLWSRTIDAIYRHGKTPRE